MSFTRLNRLENMRRWIWSLTFSYAALMLLEGVNQCVTPDPVILNSLGRWLSGLAFISLTLLVPALLLLPFSKRQETEDDYSKSALAAVSIAIVMSSTGWWLLLALRGASTNPHNDAFDRIMM